MEHVAAYRQVWNKKQIVWLHKNGRGIHWEINYSIGMWDCQKQRMQLSPCTIYYLYKQTDKFLWLCTKIMCGSCQRTWKGVWWLLASHSLANKSKINEFGLDGVQHVWRGPGQEYHRNMPAEKNRGGSVLIWGCMRASTQISLIQPRSVFTFLLLSTVFRWTLLIPEKHLLISRNSVGRSGESWFRKSIRPRQGASFNLISM